MFWRNSRRSSVALLVFWFCVGCQHAVKKGAEATNPKMDSSTEASLSPSGDVLSLSLNIDVSGFIDDEGVCRIAVYLGQEHFNDPEFAIAKESVNIHGLSASLQVELQITVSQQDKNKRLLAVSAYHDQNGNGRLDKNSFGMPTERYGFSNNPKRGFGPPKFMETALELNSEPVPEVHIVIK